MSTQNPIEILEVGIDYITATSHSSSSLSGLGAFGNFLVGEAVRRGSKKRASRTLGYTCVHADGVSCGRRDDGTFVRLSGATAAEHWLQVYDLSSNVTRLDLQVTDRTTDSPSERLRAIWRRRKYRPTTGGRPPQWKAIVGQAGIETIMIGSRASNSYLRFYDKGKESKLPQYDRALRTEAELKAEHALFMATWLGAQVNEQAAIAARICKIVSDCSGHSLRDLWESLLVNDETACERFPKATKRNVKGYAFLSVCVRPLVQRLIGAGQLDHVLEVLGLTDHVQPKQTILDHDGPTN